MRLLYLTFNQGGYTNPNIINRRLNKLLKSLNDSPDIIVVGLQEAKDINILQYFNRLLQYKMVHFDDFNQLLLGDMYLAIYMKIDIPYTIDNEFTGSERCGYTKKTIAKGCLFACIEIANVPIQLFVCHLPSNPSDVTSRDDCIMKRVFKNLNKKALVIIGGDLNYRVDETQDYKCDLKQIKNDQLNNSKVKKHLEEDKISFCQTCRLTESSKRTYDTKRIPSWCDRILYRDARYIIKSSDYSSFDLSPNSDHLAVYNMFELAIKTTTKNKNV